MKFEGNDFIRNPAVDEQIFFLESKCVICGFSILTHSIEEVVELEKSHRTQCRASQAAA